MSYDFVLFRPGDGVDPREDDGEDAPEHGARDPAVEAVKRRVVDALLAHDARLKLFAFDFDEIAKLHKMPVEQVYERFRHVEINDESERTSGIQVTLFDDRASLTIPFWHKGEDARRVLAQAWGYIGIICKECGYEAYDRQVGRVIDAGAFEDVLACYEGAGRRIEGIVRPPPARKPWWKFW
jgi:hypothetical protein